MLGVALALCSALMFSLVALLIPWAQRDVGPLAGLLAATIVQSGLAWIVAGSIGAIASYNIAGLLLFFAAGVLAVVGNLLFFRSILIAGPAYASTGKVAAMVIGVTLAATVLGEKPGLYVWIGMLIIGIGLQLLSAGKRHSVELSTPEDGEARSRHGLLFAFAGGAAFAVGNLVRKQALMAWDEPFVGPAIETMGGLVVLLLVPAVYREWKQVQHGRVWRMATVGFATLGGVVLFLLSLQYTSLSIANVLAGAEPALTLALLFLLGSAQVRHNRRLALGVVTATIGVIVVVAAGG